MGTRSGGSDEARQFCLLVVEPDFQVREILSSAFEDDRIEVVAVRGSRDARAVLLARGVDFVVTEIVLQDGDGEALGEFARDRGCGVVLLSGHPEGIRRGEAGPLRFLQKPFSVLELRRLVLAELAGAAARGDGGS